MTTVRCPHCGTANRAGSNYCNNCGTDLRPEEATTALPQMSEETSTQAPTDAPASPAPESTGLVIEQPWLRQEPAPESTLSIDDAIRAEAELASSTPTTRRLVANVQGLLDPLRLFSESDDTADEPTNLTVAAVAPADATLLRRLRGLMNSEPLLSDLNVAISLPRLPSLRIPWLFWLIGLAVGLPIFLGLSSPLGAPRLWPGVTEAFTAIHDLPPNVPILLIWAYDPATAGEMDLLAEPLASHLLEERRPLLVVSLLPGGPATARRLFQQARLRLFGSQGLQVAARAAPALNVTYLPGGSAALPLLGQNLSGALSGQITPASLQTSQSITMTPGLAVIVAAQAEDVQQWVEQVQPLNKLPVVAFTSAVADPVLRPYFDSEQLRGLVSGFDGAYSYQALRLQSSSQGMSPNLIQQVVAQNWGQLALLAVLVMGNLVGWWKGSGHE